jgi:hypothetical protein
MNFVRAGRIRKSMWAAFATCFIIYALPNVARTEDATPDPDSEEAVIRDAAKEVLDGPEFRRLRRLLEKNLGQTGLNPYGSGKGGGGSGGSGGSSGGGGSGGGGSQKKTSETKSSQTQSPGFFSGAASSLAAAFGMIYLSLAWLCVAAIVALMLYLVARAVGSRLGRNDEKPADAPTKGCAVEAESAPGDQPADVYVEAAHRLAAAGQFREAVAQLLLGAMSRIERSGLIRFRRGLTHYDYLRAVRGRETSHSALREIVRTYEPLGFGRRSATRQHFESSLQGYEALRCDD